MTKRGDDKAAQTRNVTGTVANGHDQALAHGATKSTIRLGKATRSPDLVRRPS